MPKLPTDQDLGVVPADASGRIASVSNAGAAGEATAQLGANVVQFGSTILDVHDENAQAAADSAIWRGKVALDQKYRNDPDPATAPQRYNDELTNLVSQSAGGIIQPRIKTQFMDMANRYVVARGVEMIQNQSDTALTNQAVAKLSDDGDAGVTAFAHSTDPRDQFGITQAYYGQVDAMVKARTLDATVGERLKKDFIHRAIYSNIANAGTPDEMIKRWNGFNGVDTPDATKPADATPPAPGASDSYKAAILGGESAANVSAVNPKTGAAGRYQMLPSTAAQYGLTPADLTNPDPKVQALVDVAFQKFTADNTKTLTTSLGRPPTAAELTLAHQQGAQGAAALLANPDAKAVDIVGQKAVLDNGGEPSMTAQDFSQHVMGYYGASGAPGSSAAPANENTPAEPTMATEPAPGSMASKVPADVYDTMAAGIQTELNRAQAQIDHKQAVDEKIRQQATDAAITGYQQQMVAHAADPTQPDIDMVKVSQDPRLKGDKTALPSLIAFQRSLDKPPTDDTLDKTTTAQLYRGILNGTVKAKDVQDAFAPPDNSPGKISKANLDFLQGALKNGGDTVDAKNTNALKSAFLKNSDYAITHDPSGLTINLPAAHDADYRFLTDFSATWDAKVKAGEDPKGLITPGSKDYFGTLANMSKYVKTADQWLAEAQAAQDAANPPQPGWLERTWNSLTGGGAPAPEIPADLPKGTVAAGTTKDGRPAFKLPNGKLVAVGAAPAAPAASAAVIAPAPVTAATIPPTVPSGE